MTWRRGATTISRKVVSAIDRKRRRLLEDRRGGLLEQPRRVRSQEMQGGDARAPRERSSRSLPASYLAQEVGVTDSSTALDAVSARRELQRNDNAKYGKRNVKPKPHHVAARLTCSIQGEVRQCWQHLRKEKETSVTAAGARSWWAPFRTSDDRSWLCSPDTKT